MKSLDKPLKTLWKLATWPPLLFVVIIAASSFFTIPAALQQFDKVQFAYSKSAEGALMARTGGYLPLIREVQRRVPPDEAILVKMKPGATLLFWDRVINYWLYPRKVYSVTALKSAGEDVAAFAKRHSIRWRFAMPNLTRVTPGEPPEAPADLPCSLHTSSFLRVALGVTLALAHFLAVGACLLGAMGVLPLLSAWPERVAYSFLLGSSAVGGWTLISFALGFGVSLWTVGPSLLVALLTLLSRRLWSRRAGLEGERLGRRSVPITTAGNINLVALILVGILLGLLTLRAMALPMSGYDDRFQWAHKAHIMLHEDSLWGDGFQDPQTLHFHPKYPLLIPSIEAVVFLYAGGFNDQYVTLLFPLFAGALAVILYSGLGALGRTQGSGIAVVALLWLPFYWGYGMNRDAAAAFTAYPDLPLAVFMAAAMLCLLRGWRLDVPPLYRLAACLALAAALTKAEGKIHAVVFFTSAFGLLVMGGRRIGLRHALICFGIAGAAIALHEYFIVFRTQPGILPDNYGSLSSWSQVASNASRLPEIARHLVSDFAQSPRFGYIGFMLLAALALWRRRAGERMVLVPLLYTLVMLVLFCVPYLLLAEAPWRSIYLWSAERLISQIVPIGILSAALLVLPASEADGPS